LVRTVEDVRDLSSYQEYVVHSTPRRSICLADCQTYPQRTGLKVHRYGARAVLADHILLHGNDGAV
jgi:hypothetical protein